ncbi:DUF6226 family protein [Microbacterium sp. zg-Y818]|uniref:DUF6226 family protein n=1 Tax=unclassified Microbacterium TaxID=2609290 RepID=UPI00214AFB63|nr:MULTISPECIES: DUF6226 family protein [unclassified Microbacterium]MCR2799447.1 DUF6226 family protein [Microbacterium sp. zg.Y818]WIM21444.1 DUF6226 family protein [Microbacterium sp. zg-Y818]
MTDYVRPDVAPQTFTDEAGTTVDYGGRWPQSPPSESYSVVSNRERFAPLHAVAEALIAWLAETFDVAVVDDPAASDDLLRLPASVTRAVRVTPSDPDAAVLTFVFTAFPGVILHAGLLHDFPFPVCGCDACDETWERGADEMEWTVRTVVEGGFAEGIDRRRQLPVFFSLDEPGVATSSGSGRAEDYPADRLLVAAPLLPRDELWAPWPFPEGEAAFGG